MASGSYARKPTSQEPKVTQVLVTPRVPQRATRQLPELEADNIAAGKPSSGLLRKTMQLINTPEEEVSVRLHTTQIVVDQQAPRPLERHTSWLKPLVICMVLGIIFLGVVTTASIFNHPGEPQLVNFFGGKMYSIQVGGDQVNTWQTPVPIPPKVNIPKNTGPYSVLGKPTITPDFINKVLAANHSPAAGKGQALYDLGVKYGIDPVYALAFFMHESSFGTAGEARVTMSLGNLRCISTRPCVDQDRGGYAQMQSWEDGFEVWYKLIRNYYVAQLGKETIYQIIPTYAPAADHNNELAYINSLKNAVDTWHSGQILVY